MALLRAKDPLPLFCAPHVNITGIFPSYSLPKGLAQSSQTERVEQQVYLIFDKNSTISWRRMCVV